MTEITNNILSETNLRLENKEIFLWILQEYLQKLERYKNEYNSKILELYNFIRLMIFCKILKVWDHFVSLY